MANVVQYLGNVYILEESPGYLREVRKYADLVRSTHCGRTLFRHVNSKPKWMLIIPFHWQKDGRANAYAFPRNESNADAYAPGHVSRTTTVDLGRFGKLELPIEFGTGKGSVVYVKYHPATWNEYIRRKGGYIGPGSGPGEILFHEMVHGLRMQAGLLRVRDKVADEQGMDNVEEFHSIFAANVYRSERGFSKMRADHHGFKPVSGSLDNGGVYYELQGTDRQMVHRTARLLPRHGARAREVQSIPTRRR